MYENVVYFVKARPYKANRFSQFKWLNAVQNIFIQKFNFGQKFKIKQLQVIKQ